MNTNFLKKIYNEDVIYHYTKASTAIDYILYNNQLRFSKARNSSDPIESMEARRVTVYHGNKAFETQNTNEIFDADELHDFALNLENKFYQICFCANSGKEKEQVSQFIGNEELFGFTKPRMWDQYADRYTGVCIALSKKKILSKNKDRLGIIDGNIKYLKYVNLFTKKLGDIQGNHLKNIGKHAYKKQIAEIIEESFFYKHIDYSGENEYRLGIYYDEKKCSAEKIKGKLVFNESIMLDILDCIEAIFVSSYTSDKQKNDLFEYSQKLKIPMIEMIWKYDSFEAINYDDEVNFIKEIKNSIK